MAMSVPFATTTILSPSAKVFPVTIFVKDALPPPLIVFVYTAYKVTFPVGVYEPVSIVPRLEVLSSAEPALDVHQPANDQPEQVAGGVAVGRVVEAPYEPCVHDEVAQVPVPAL